LLKPGIIYHYDLEFNPESAGGPVDEYDNNLSKQGLLSEDLRSVTLGYGDGILPSFALPPSDLTKLRIFQGSCRKPHAPGIDALSILDDALVATHDKPLDRPHQLFLTGDQIYADDVGAALLKELTAVGTQLLGWTETIPGVNKPLSDPSLAPEKRQDIVSTWALFRSDHAWNHLLGLGEFYAMYLFAWSDELWPRTLTRFEQPPFKRDLATDVDILGEQIVDEYEESLSRLRKSRYKEVVERVREARTNLDKFQAYLPNVRRILANVPTYMVFDDHEVTDDWYLNGLFAREILDPGNHLARRILTNALTAFSIFQAWGNTPERFESGPGHQLLQAATGWNGQDTTKLQSLATLVGVVDWGKPQPPDRLLFDFSLTGPKHHVIVLDTRTWRRFAGDKEPAELISEDAMRRQLTDRLVSNPNSEVVLVVSPAPVLGLRLLEECVQPIVAELQDVFAADLEAWKANEKGFQRLLRALSQGRKVVLLSGDVHYGFTASCEFFDAAGSSAVYAQLTSSALKNEDHSFKGTVTLHRFGHFVDVIDLPREFVCWNNEPQDNLKINLISPPLVDIEPGGSNGYVLAHIAKTERPAVVEPMWIQNANQAPQWSYRLRFSREARDHPHPKRTAGAPPPVQLPPTSSDRSSYLSWYRSIARHHGKYLNHLGAGRWIVGFNNLGEITFDVSPLKVFHRLWWKLEDDPEPAPLTQYEIDLTKVGPRPTVSVE